MLGISGTELVLILFFGFLIFGPEKLPQMGRTVGRAIRQFRSASDAANQKFKDEVYDPFKDAVQPYAEEAQKQGAPLKEDLDAINKNLQETSDLFKDPFKTSSSSDSTSTSAEPKDSISSMAKDMLSDPFKSVDANASDSDASASPASKPAPGTGQPVPKTGGTVKKGLAEQLYDLDDDTESTTKGGE